MKNPRTLSISLLCSIALFIILLSNSAQVFAQAQLDYEAERKRALQLMNENKFPDALLVLEKLISSKPDDAVVLEHLAAAIFATAAVSKKVPEEIRKDLIRARSLAQKAKDLGNNTQLVQLILKTIPPDGNPGALVEQKRRTPAEEALFDGETVFAKGDMERAIEHYERAAKLHPKLYEAPLFIGDAYYKMKKIDKAGEAYARAIAIAPDRETAYRYWGSVLMSEGQMQESKEKFIDAIIAEPYNRAPWQFLVAWTQRNQAQLVHPRIEVPTSSVQRKDDNTINIPVNPTDKQDVMEAWMLYSLERASWMTGKKFAEAFPDEKVYRHTLREEAQALRLTAESVVAKIKEGKLEEQSLDPSIANLLKLHNAGLIEAYVLFAKPDDGITRDYSEYRKNNRDKLRRYLTEYVIVKK